jgi:hypothetical protein
LAKQNDYHRTTSILTEPECRWQQTLVASTHGMTRPAHGSDVAILKNQTFTVPGSQDSGIDHSTGEVVGSDYLIGEQRTKHRVDPAQESVAEIRFLPGFDGVDVGGPKNINTRKPGREKCIFGFSLVARERYATSACRVRAIPAQE